MAGICVVSGGKTHLELVGVWSFGFSIKIGKFFEYVPSWIFFFQFRKFRILDFQICLAFECLFLIHEKFKITK